MAITKLGSVLDDAAMTGIVAVKSGKVLDEMNEPVSHEEDAKKNKKQKEKENAGDRTIRQPNR